VAATAKLLLPGALRRALTGDQLVTKVNFKSKSTSGTANMAFRPSTALLSSTTNQNLLSSVSATGSANYTIDALGPDLSITAPVSGSTLSGPSVNIEANAADSAGVAGVQFMLDGNNLGAEITTSPYSFVWDSTTVTDGTHTTKCCSA
jgi:hypothetical protein